MRLFLDVGHCDRSAKRTSLAGKSLAAIVDAGTEADHGALLAVAEGVPGRPDSDRAAAAAIAALADTYYAAAITGSVYQALNEAFRAANGAVLTGGERNRAATLTALVLQGRRWYVGHLGNLRAWRCRDQRIKQLTRDHLVPRALGRVEIVQALGFAETIEFEYSEGELSEGDIYVLTSPGVHDALHGSALLGVLQSDGTTQQMADALTQRALTPHAPVYLGACVARVERLPAKATAQETPHLPVVALPARGTEIDGFLIDKLVLKSRRFQLFKATDRESGATVALRFPDSSNEPNAAAFLREEHVSRRLESPYLMKPLTLRPGRRTALYSVLEYRRAENLSKRIRRECGLPLEEAIPLAEQLLSVVEALHNQGVIHRDIRANNLLCDRETRQLLMLGLGIERGQVAIEDSTTLRASTLSYWAPELFAGARANERTDIYAAGVTLYRMLSGKYPYGKIRSPEDWKTPRVFVPLTRYRPELPADLDAVLERACAIDSGYRYTGAAQFAAALSGAYVGTESRAAVNGNDTAETKRLPASLWLAAVLGSGFLVYLYFALR